MSELNKRTRNVEEMLSEYVLVLSEDERADLNEAMEEYAAGKTTSSEDVERIPVFRVDKQSRVYGR